MAAIRDRFEYADTAALDAEWGESVTTLSIATWDIDTLVTHRGSYAAKLTVVGTPSAGDEAVRRHTYTEADGIRASTTYYLSMWVWLNEEFGANTGHDIRFGIRVPDQGESFVQTPSVGNDINTWTQVTLTVRSTPTAHLVVEFGAFDASATAHNRLVRFDDLNITDNPWSDILLDTGVLTVGGAVVGFTVGGLTFDLERAFVQRQVEGVLTPVLGMEYVGKVRAKFVGTMLTANLATRAMIEPGATTTEVGDDTTTYTPVPLLTELSAGQYLTNVAVTWRRAGGGHLRVRFPKALCVKYGIEGKSRAEALIPVEIEARLDEPGGAALTDSPYFVDVIDDA